MSEPEVMLWARLKRLREQGYHFRRQAPLLGYFLDFVCYSRRLIVEVDGSQHGDDRQAEHDAIRDRLFAQHGFVVMRFWTTDVRSDIGWVMDRIIEALEAATPTHEGQSRSVELEPHSPTLLACGELSLPIKGGKAPASAG